MLAQPALSLAQPLSRVPAPPRPAVQNHVTQDGSSFKVPFDVNVRPRSLHEPTNQPTLETTLLRPRWRGWAWIPGALWAATPCYSSNGLWQPWAATPTGAFATPNLTIGSLVDGQSHTLLSPDFSQSTGPQLQYGLQPAPCGASSSFGL